MWNTPPTFNIYTTGNAGWIESEGGIREMQERAHARQAPSCRFTPSDGFYSTPCAIPAAAA